MPSLDNVVLQSSASASRDKDPKKGRNCWQRTHNALHFERGYNFILFIIFAGAMLGFTLARLSYINVTGSAKSSYKNSSAPGEWYWFRTTWYRFGLTLHLATILPAGFLMIWQFVPIIRHKVILFHRINGYIIILLVFISNVGAMLIARRSFGGTLDTQAGVGTLVILTTTSICLAYYNIKRLQIDQHRKWMLRAMFYLGTIITLRFIFFISALIVSRIGSYYSTMSCDHLQFLYEDKPGLYAHKYPQCINGTSTVDGMVVVKAEFGTSIEATAASMDLSFGMAMWLAIILHVVGVEIYLHLTPKESERLRKLSYERQMEKGFSNPGSSGLTSDKLGDADNWQPVSV